MNAASALVIVVDGLAARYLGPYGATWIETPAFNRLAAESLLAEQAYAGAPALASAYDSLWNGWNAGAPAARSQSWLAQQLAARGVATTLLTDDRALAGHPGAEQFAQRILIPRPPCAAPAKEIAETALARLIALAIDFLEKAKDPFLLWVHASGMCAEWDSPLECREPYRDEGDPPAYAGTTPPANVSPAGFDPDELLPLACAYAGQTALLDACLDALLDAADAAEQRGPLALALTSVRGYPLGEHRVIGLAGPDTLHEELTHIPLLLRFPSRVGAGQRTQALTLPADLCATLAAPEGIADSAPTDRPISASRGLRLWPLAENERAPWRKHALAFDASGRRRAARTRWWSLIRTAGESPADEAKIELFVKPDDRTDANEIASRCPLVAEAMTALLEEAQAAAAADRPVDESRFSDVVFEPPTV